VAGVIEYGDDGVVVIYAAALGTDVHHVGEAGPLLPLFVGGGSSVVTLSGGAVQ
jgi:hypothetical protein